MGFLYTHSSVEPGPLMKSGQQLEGREMSLFQWLNCMQELSLGKENVSLLERCPHFKGVLR